MSAFCVETQEKTMVFSALKDDCVDWVEKLCHSTFKVRLSYTLVTICRAHIMHILLLV